MLKMRSTIVKLTLALEKHDIICDTEAKHSMKKMKKGYKKLQHLLYQGV